MVTTLDVVSGGRAILGIGTAWNADEHAGYGIPFPPARERMDRLDEALTITRRMFTRERPSFAGRYYQIDRALNSPRPLQSGGPKILVGGGSRRGQPVEFAVPERAAEVLSQYVEAGARGFMFRNPNLTTPELLEAAGEVKRLFA
jgi:alkanesulfonate monooxygenase SsuD/methylene tetrahydromethanopterin reductase-like flavin-dependent oxidoreductase (luciferase family)